MGVPANSSAKRSSAISAPTAFLETGVLDANIPLDSVYPVYTFYTIQEGDLKFVGDLPKEPQEQAKKKYLPYTSLLEFLTERYHCAPEFLAKINPGKKLETLKPGDEVRVPECGAFQAGNRPGERATAGDPRIQGASYHDPSRGENARSHRGG